MAFFCHGWGGASLNGITHVYKKRSLFLELVQRLSKIAVTKQLAFKLCKLFNKASTKRCLNTIILLILSQWCWKLQNKQNTSASYVNLVDFFFIFFLCRLNIGKILLYIYHYLHNCCVKHHDFHNIWPS